MGKKGEQQSSYPPEIKLEAIRLHLEEGVLYREITTKLGISSCVIKACVKEYLEGRRDFSPNLSKPHLTYTAEIKLEAVRLHEEMGVTYKDVMSRLGIVSKAKIKEWIYRYRRGEREFADLRALKSTGNQEKPQMIQRKSPTLSSIWRQRLDDLRWRMLC